MNEINEHIVLEELYSMEICIIILNLGLTETFQKNFIVWKCKKGCKKKYRSWKVLEELYSMEINPYS